MGGEGMKCWICIKDRARTKICSRCGEISCSGCNDKGVCLVCLAKEVCED